MKQTYKCTQSVTVEVMLLGTRTTAFTEGKEYRGELDQTDSGKKAVRFFDDDGRPHLCIIPFLNKHFAIVEAVKVQ